MQTPAKPKQNQWRAHAEPERKPCITDAGSMQNPCRPHAEPMQNPRRSNATSMQNPRRSHAEPMQTTLAFVLCFFAAFAPQLDDGFASLEALELLLPRRLAARFLWRPALARLLAAWASSSRAFSTTASRRAAGPVAYAACLSRRRCKARTSSGSDSDSIWRYDNRHPGSPIGHTRRRIGARRAPWSRCRRRSLYT